MPISTKNLQQLPSPSKLKLLCQSLATLDAIIEPEWESRYWSFNNHWSDQESMGSMRDGEGDDLFVWFGPPGVTIKGFAHEAPMSPYAINGKICPGILDHVPSAFKTSIEEPAFTMEATTFFVWRTKSDETWKIGPVDYVGGDDPDGSEELLVMFDGKPETYQKWAESYYETSIPLKAVKQIYNHAPLTEELVKDLNKEISLKDLLVDLQEIGYPGVLYQPRALNN